MRVALPRGAFLPTMLKLAGPIALQQLVFSVLNVVEVLMLGQLGDTPVAAISLAKQIFFLLSLFLFGVSSGSAIFAAQFWGQRNLVGLRHVLGICLGLGIAVSLLFAVGAIGFPQVLLGLYSQDPAVVAQGSEYLWIVGLSYVASAVTFSYAAILRSAEYVRLPTVVGILTTSLNTLLSYLLIFGLLGLPALGVRGAAIATCTARYLECAVLLAATYLTRSPAAARIGQLVTFGRAFLGRFLKTCLPVVLTEVLWSLGVTAYSAVYARIGTTAITAYSISSTIEALAFVPFIGIANAAAIMIGNAIGAGEEQRAHGYARRFLLIGVVGAVLVGLGILAGRDAILALYQVSPEAQRYASSVLVVMGCALWVKIGNMMVLIGAIRSGGDTRFGFLVDAGPMWLVGVPMALLGAFVFRLPIHWVVAMVAADEVTKLAIGLPRVLSRRWIHNLVGRGI